jgi:hypothetical protein
MAVNYLQPLLKRMAQAFALAVGMAFLSGILLAWLWVRTTQPACACPEEIWL